ncbi:MAG: pilus (MSHA type) biogenesis protein MshL [Gammaproteobacteria bacterium]|nr:pilus (MSHA type) biogenesis protein MshL [Gammaproteobacteria bacterium]MDH5628956.1 pilus (MSHA type) biogenesis protein MshL [Gammaproteobacteria bacterium]
MNRYIVIILGFILYGCQTYLDVDSKQMAVDAIEENADSTTVPNEQTILDSMIPPIKIEPVTPEERFDVSVNNMDAKSFLLSLVNDSSYNMVVSPEIKLKISLQLKNVTIDEVIKAVERIYPISIEKQGMFYIASSAESMTIIYPVDYINLSREGKSHTRVAGQTMNMQNQQSQNQQQYPAGNNQQQNNALQFNSSEILTESKADFWEELQKSLELITQSEKTAQVVVSPHSGVVIVKALPKTQRVVRDFLGITQQNLNRQVTLEAKIIEVSLNEGFQSGIDWQKIYSVRDGTNNLTIAQQGQILSQQASPLAGVFSLLYQGATFDTAIDLLKTQGDVHVLSSPRISTVNNQKAIIKVGSDEFFVTDVSTTTVTGTSTATTPDVTLTPFFSGISLDVTPQINQNGDIILHIHPVVSEVSDQQKSFTLGAEQFNLPLALTNVRESDSVVRAKDQQIIVIGGLMQNRVSKSQNKTPLAGDVPIVGNLFKQRSESMIKSELVILLKANLSSDQFNNQQIQQIKQRIKAM